MSTRIQFPKKILERGKEIQKACFAFALSNSALRAEMFSFIGEDDSDKLLKFMSRIANGATPQEAFAAAWETGGEA